VNLFSACWAMLLIGLAAQQPTAPGFDYEVFKARIQPIFLAKRPGHARCVSCHSAGTAFRLQPLAPGATTWTEEETHKNFDAMRRVAAPGNLKSRILVHPLAEAAGGDFFHSGGKHWQSQADHEWQALRAWIMGETKNSNQ